MKWLSLLVLSLVGLCVTTFSASAADVAARSPVNIVVGIEGDVALEREGWRDSTPVLFGTVVKIGDLLRPSQTGKVIIACADLSVMSVSSAATGMPCRSADPILYREGSRVLPVRDGSDSGLGPIVLAPRKTSLLDPRPRIRWSAVDGVTAYKVQVQGRGVNWTTDVVSKTEIAYSGDALLPGVAYKVIVSAGGHRSDEDGAPGLGFTILRPEEAGSIQVDEKKIRDLRLSESATRLLVATYFADRKLNAEAIEHLEALLALNEPAPLRLLADLYLRIGLNTRAEATYLKAAEVSKRKKDLEGQALAQAALARLYHEAFSNQQEASRYADEAIGIYIKLGDETMVNTLQALKRGSQ
jgi:hypothetical protein